MKPWLYAAIDHEAFRRLAERLVTDAARLTPRERWSDREPDAREPYRTMAYVGEP